MKLRLLNDSALRTLKSGVHNNTSMYIGSDIGWLSNFFADRRNTFESKIDSTEVELLIPQGEDRKEYDAINASRLYLAFPKISAAQATDERLWATLCHHQFYDYMKARWPAVATQKGQTPEGIIEQRYFFYRGPRKSQERNGLARLWLCAALTYDTERSNPFELTEAMLQNTNFIFYLFGHNFGSNKNIIQGTLEAMRQIERETSRSVTRTPLKEYARRLNLIGGASSLDILSKEDITRDAYNFMRSMV